MTHPGTFSVRILLVVSGMSPQILTETVYALVHGKDPFVPTQIHMLTTAEGARVAKLNLLHPETGHYYRLCREYDLPVAFDPSSIHVITDPKGYPLVDIRSIEENETAGDFILNWVRKLTVDPNSALHVSIAGGRKTMGYYAGYALSLFGRGQDRLSHVLVAEGYESHQDFYYPSRKSRVIYRPDGRPLDTSDAEIELAEIPFLRLRRHLPPALLNGDHSFRQAIDLAQRAQGNASLSLRPKEGRFCANGVEGRLSPKLMAFWLWFYDRQKQGMPAIAPPAGEHGDLNYAMDFLKTAEKYGVWLRSNSVAPLEKRGMDRAFFEQTKSRLNGVLKNVLGGDLAQRFCIAEEGCRGYTRYHLPGDIEVCIADE